MSYTCHSGGCPGSDMFWETEGLKYGVKTISYSFWNHKHEGRNPKILSGIELKEGYEAAKKADIILKRNFDRIQYQYVKNLLARNWFQIKNSDTTFAVGKFSNKKLTIVDGGTGWAVQMSIDNNRPVFVFDQKLNGWFKFNYHSQVFEQISVTPTLTKNFAGIGTRELQENGKLAICEVYKNSFCFLRIVVIP
jgi:hypothetical protein